MTQKIIFLLQMPFLQVLIFLLLTMVAFVFYRPRSADGAWSVAGLYFIGFMVFNSIVICTVHNHWIYFFISILFSVLYLLIIAILIPSIIKIFKMNELAESAMIFIFIIYHPVLLLLSLFLKWTYLQIFY